ncbi:hypothetical protein [Sphingomonas xinjiangensis]|uniref:Uncharacterized protein n=1 Tax=Sphingomonas xinjiangensis TaxID=643568 RepID=A0A840YT13_9SPHN|nr:hypothetical protein [Sphingomonas xinjiangensis]MBB5712814.1 hypothetical protein [Sphingomonas xinjiangensis]
MKDVGAGGTGFLNEVVATDGAEAMSIVVLTQAPGFVEVDRAESGPTLLPPRVGLEEPADQLRQLLSGREVDDILTTAQGDHLRILDLASDALPLARTQERTRNTLLQQRTHLRTWLARGRDAGANIGAGHIRWGKVTKGLTGKLAEFTVRYSGPAPSRGHLIVVELLNGAPANGFVGSDGHVLDPAIVISNKARLRQEMARALRTFGGATRLAI